MNPQIEIAESGRAEDADCAVSPGEGVWHASAAVVMAIMAAALLAVAGTVPVQVLLGLGIMAFPGIIGAIWRPGREAAFPLLLLWAVGAAVAVCVTGGLAGPLAALCITPILACMAVGGSWRAGAGTAVAAVLICALAGGLHLVAPLPAEPVRSGLTALALLVAVVGAGGALLVMRRRSDGEREEIEAELSAFQSIMGDLPELALALGADGRTEAVFGQPLPGLDLGALHRGLAHAAAPADRSRLDAAIDEALDHGSAHITFASASESDKRIAAVLQRTGTGGLTAILRAAPPPLVRVPPAVPAASSDLALRLAAAEAGRREAEIGRDKAEANATARARFLANMSHELRTPLNAIMGFSDMMRAKMFGALPPKYAEYAELIHESGGHLLDLINDVLDMSKIEAQRYTLDREMFDVREALNAALRLMRLQADDAGVKLRAVLPAGPLEINADKRAVKQIALNLLSNALKFTPAAGTVILSAQAAAGVLEIVVADTGMGIAAEDLKRLGQPFEQAGGADDRTRGTGLGLSLVNAFATLHGGSMTLESRLGEGTAVTVRMPVLVTTTQSAAAPQVVTPEPEPLPPLEAKGPEPRQAEPSPAEPAQVEPKLAEPEAPPSDPAALDDTQSAPPAESAPAAEALLPSAPIQDAPAPAAAPTLVPTGNDHLNSRAADHHGLRHSVLSIFAPRRANALADATPGDPNQPHSGVRILR